MEPLLLVEDKIELRAMLRKALERNGFRVEEAPDGSAAIQKIRAKRYQMVVTDLKMPGASGLDVLRESKQADSTIPVILLTAFGSVEEAVSAMKEGAFDFIQKPVDLDHLKLLVQRAARQQELLRENLLLREEYAARYGFPRIVGEHASIRQVGQQIQRIAGHCFWTKLASSRLRFKRNCCACWRNDGSTAWAGRSRLKWTCASWWLRTAICRNRCGRNCFARICIFASLPCR